MSAFQDNLKKFRERSGYSAKEFAAEIDIKYTTYANYENAGSEPKYDTLIKIAAALHVSIDDLLGYKQAKLKYWLDFLGKNFKCERIIKNLQGELSGIVTLYYRDDETLLMTEYTEEELTNLLENLGNAAQRKAGEIIRDIMTKDVIRNMLRRSEEIRNNGYQKLIQKLDSQTQKNPPTNQQGND